MNEEKGSKFLREMLLVAAGATPPFVMYGEEYIMDNEYITLAKGMNARFPEGNEPYQIMTRLLEECGEVAKEVHHFENSGTKCLRHGEPSKEKLAGEVKDVMNALMQLVLYYDVEEELEVAVSKSIQQLTEEGYING